MMKSGAKKRSSIQSVDSPGETLSLYLLHLAVQYQKAKLGERPSAFTNYEGRLYVLQDTY